MWSIIAANPLQVALLCLVLGLFFSYFIYKYFIYNETTSSLSSKRLTSITPIVDNVEEISNDNYSDDIHPIMINLDITEFEEKNDNSNDSSDSNFNSISGSSSSDSNEDNIGKFNVNFDSSGTSCSYEAVEKHGSNSSNSNKSDIDVIVCDEEYNYKINRKLNKSERNHNCNNYNNNDYNNNNFDDDDDNDDDYSARNDSSDSVMDDICNDDDNDDDDEDDDDSSTSLEPEQGYGYE